MGSREGELARDLPGARRVAWRERRRFGIVRGVLAGSLVRPPIALVEIDPPIAMKVGCGNMTSAQIARALVDAYRRVGSGRYMRALASRHHDDEAGWCGSRMLMAVAEALRAAGRSPDAYVSFVCAAHEKARGAFPFPEQVFGARALRG